MPTYIPKADALGRRWFVIDASGKVLGNVAVAAADALSGKRKPIYTPFLDTGVMGGLKTRSAREVRQAHPVRLIEEAIRGMLPKTKLGRAMFLKLKVYGGSKHPHQAQKPQPLTL